MPQTTVLDKPHEYSRPRNSLATVNDRSSTRSAIASSQPTLILERRSSPSQWSLCSLHHTSFRPGWHRISLVEFECRPLVVLRQVVLWMVVSFLSRREHNVGEAYRGALLILLVAL